MSKKTETAALTVAATEGTQKCQGACGETLSVRKFPTVHGKTGISRGTECRKDRDARYEAAKTARIAAEAAEADKREKAARRAAAKAKKAA